MNLMQRLKLALLAVFVSIGGLGGAALLPATVSAAPQFYVGSSKSDACAGLNELGAGQGCGSNGQQTVGKVAKAVVQIISIITGIFGVIMVVISGFKYITSGGDPGSVSSAKRTLIYALVGLAIAAIAEFLVHFVINSAVKAGGG